MPPSLSVIVASGGRPTLTATIDSIVGQLDVCDELLMIVDERAPFGHASRNRAMRSAHADWLLFQDDDSTYTPGALAIIRMRVAAGDLHALHIFRMRRRDGHEVWSDPQVRAGNVYTQMIAVANQVPLPPWGADHDGALQFIDFCARHRPTVWHQEVISVCV